MVCRPSNAEWLRVVARSGVRQQRGANWDIGLLSEALQPNCGSAGSLDPGHGRQTSTMAVTP
ncbi:hypothetical protein GS506_18775 [Rhodococcus hoagii]|nr:hypothetical protein [Prescottella equi]